MNTSPTPPTENEDVHDALAVLSLHLGKTDDGRFIASVISKLSTDRDAALSRADRAEKALAFYANAKNWEPVSDDPEVPGSIRVPVIDDEGRLARAALSNLKAPRS